MAAVSPAFLTYAENKEVFELLEGMLKSVVLERPSDPLSHLLEYLQKKPVFRIILHGAPLSGKSSVAYFLAQKTGAVNLDTSALLAEAMANKELKDKLEPILAAGTPVPDSLLTSLVLQRLQQPDCTEKGWILHGFPNTRRQSLALQTAGMLPTHFLHLEAPDATLAERLEGRCVDSKTGAIYHSTFHPPPAGATVTKPPHDSEDKFRTQLQDYHRNAPGMNECYGKTARRLNMDQPLDDACSAAWNFICTKRQTNAPYIPRVLLLGPAAAGKTTQARILLARYNAVHISVDVLVRQAIAKKSPLGKKIEAQGAQGADDAQLVELVLERVSSPDCNANGWVLDGFPTTRAQAEMLLAAKVEPNSVIVLDVADETLIERACLRRIDPETGRGYHLLYAPPSDADVQDRLEQRAEDREDVVAARIAGYRQQCDDVLELFPNAQHVNGDQDIMTVFEELESFMVRPLQPRLE
eukprot:m.203152 g.203152  ORF g.203152 m.203152 type:complete len:469 (+) comp21973_c0_seq2:1678-3084(+)